MYIYIYLGHNTDSSGASPPPPQIPSRRHFKLTDSELILYVVAIQLYEVVEDAAAKGERPFGVN